MRQHKTTHTESWIITWPFSSCGNKSSAALGGDLPPPPKTRAISSTCGLHVLAARELIGLSLRVNLGKLNFAPQWKGALIALAIVISFSQRRGPRARSIVAVYTYSIVAFIVCLFSVSFALCIYIHRRRHSPNEGSPLAKMDCVLSLSLSLLCVRVCAEDFGQGN